MVTTLMANKLSYGVVTSLESVQTLKQIIDLYIITIRLGFRLFYLIKKRTNN